VARPTVPEFIRRLGEASKVVSALGAFLEHVATLLRQVVHIVGWLVLLASSVSLLFHPHFSPPALLIPGAGSLAVLQGLIKPRRRR
jgi:hypothetical protein